MSGSSMWSQIPIGNQLRFFPGPLVKAVRGQRLLRPLLFLSSSPCLALHFCRDPAEDYNSCWPSSSRSLPQHKRWMMHCHVLLCTLCDTWRCEVQPSNKDRSWKDQCMWNVYERWYSPRAPTHGGKTQTSPQKSGLHLFCRKVYRIIIRN